MAMGVGGGTKIPCRKLFWVAMGIIDCCFLAEVGALSRAINPALGNSSPAQFA